MSRFIFWASSFLTQEQMPGWVSILILCWLVLSAILLVTSTRRKLATLRWLEGLIAKTASEEDFTAQSPRIDSEVKTRRTKKGYVHIHPGYQHNSFDCLLHSLMTRKRRLASSALWPMGDTDEDASRLQQMLADGASGQTGDPSLVGGRRRSSHAAQLPRCFHEMNPSWNLCNRAGSTYKVKTLVCSQT
jgi:hypothetical protein